MIPNVLSIAGSDPSGGAGIQADLKTFFARRCYGMAVLTSLTAQNTQGVSAIHIPPVDFLVAQIDAIFRDIRVDAVKIGMLASGEVARAVADRLAYWGAKNVVLDPVLVATSGDRLGAPDVVAAMREALFPLARVVTPNLPEAARLSDLPEAADLADMRAAGRALVALGARAVLVKGGHLAESGPAPDALDLLIGRDGERLFRAPRVETRNTHGTGCTLSSAIAAELARGADLPAAVEAAKAALTRALAGADALSVGTGAGHGPLDHFVLRD